VIALDRLGDYIELLRIEMKLQGRELVMQLAGYAVAALFAILTAVFAGIAVLASYWDTPQRGLAAWLVVLGYAAIAAGAVYFSRKHVYRGSAFSTLRNELKRDVDLVKESI
jgi:uncharacterized membrane protein YqjE